MGDARRTSGRAGRLGLVAVVVCWLGLVSSAVAGLAPGSTTIVSAPHGGFAILGPPTEGDLAGVQTVSADGRYVLFRSEMPDLVAGTPPGPHLFRWDRLTDSYVLVDRAADGTPAPGEVWWGAWGAMTADGRYVAFEAAGGLTPETAGSEDAHVYLRDLQAGSTVLVSRGDGASGAVGMGRHPSIAVDAAAGPGTPHVVVAFESSASLVAGDPPNGWDVYVRDVTAGTTELISAGSSAGGEARAAQISRNGRFVVFESRDRDLVAGTTDADLYADVFRHDRAASANATVEISSAANAPSLKPDVSGDGSVVVFMTWATNLSGATDTNGAMDVVRWQGGSATYQSRNASSTGNARSESVTVSDDGRVVGFTSQATNLGPAVPAGGHLHAYVRTLSGVSVVDRPAGAGTSVPADGTDLEIALAGDGSAAVFSSGQESLSDADDTNTRDVFMRVLADDQLLLVSEGPGRSGLSHSEVNRGAVSRDGRFVAFTSMAEAFLPPGVWSEEFQAYVKDMTTGALTLVSRADGPGGAVAPQGAEPDSRRSPRISDDGTRVAWIDAATAELFVRDLPAARTLPISTRPGDSWSSTEPREFAITADGRRVAFSTSQPLVAADTNTHHDVYVRDVDGGALQLVSRGDGEHAPAGDDASLAPEISGDGTRVAFAGRADFGEGGGTRLVYVRDLLAHDTSLASRADGATGAPPDRDVTTYDFSGDGQHVAFATRADNLAAADAGRDDLFVRRLASDTTAVVHDQPATGNYLIGQDVEISDDGRFVMFAVDEELVPADTQPREDVYLTDTHDGTLHLIDRADGPEGPVRSDDNRIGGIALSGNGRCAAFTTQADNLRPGMPPGQSYDRVWMRALAHCPPPAPADGPPSGTAPTAPPPAQTGPARDTIAPVLTRVALGRRTFAAGSRRRPVARSRGARRGTTIRFTLSEDARVEFRVLRRQPGRRAGRRCLAPTRSRSRRPACTRLVPHGKFHRRETAGARTVAWSGWIGRRKLRPGTYRLALRAVDAAGNVGNTAVVPFRVVRPRAARDERRAGQERPTPRPR